MSGAKELLGSLADPEAGLGLFTLSSGQQVVLDPVDHGAGTPARPEAEILFVLNRVPDGDDGWVALARFHDDAWLLRVHSDMEHVANTELVSTLVTRARWQWIPRPPLGEDLDSASSPDYSDSTPLAAVLSQWASRTDPVVGLFSDFAGTHVDRVTLEACLGRKVDFVILSEADRHLRWVLQQKFGYPVEADGFVLAPDGTLVWVRTDAWALFRSKAATALASFLAALPASALLFFVAGSPCQDLTTYGSHGGLCGWTGARSQHMHAVAVLVWLCQTLRPDLATFPLLENAGSMRVLHKDYWRTVWQAAPAALQALDAATWAMATRNRLFLSSWPAVPVPSSPAPSRPWDQGWALHPWRSRALPPWMTARGPTPAGNVVVSTVAYHPEHLLY